MTKSTKPKKPYPDFPLFPHQRGYWTKKIRGKQRNFGPWCDPDGALKRYLAERDDLHAGRTPRHITTDGLTVAGLCNAFLTFKQDRLDSGELAPRSFQLYHQTCQWLVNCFTKDRLVVDLVATDFQHLRAEMAKRLGVVALGNEVQRARCVFRYGYEAGLFDAPIRFGPGFKKPSAKALRQNRAKRGLRMFEEWELLAVLGHANTNMKAMVLLGINAGLGNTDCGLLPISAVDLAGAVLDYPREKTAIPRVVPLWPETIDAIEKVLTNRPVPKDAAHRGLLFIGLRGEPYIGRHKGYRVAQEATRLLNAAGVARDGLSFYGLRRTFSTVAEGAHDLPAVEDIMGHAHGHGDMAAVYRQRVNMERKKAVVAHVRAWLYGEAQNE